MSEQDSKGSSTVEPYTEIPRDLVRAAGLPHGRIGLMTASATCRGPKVLGSANGIRWV